MFTKSTLKNGLTLITVPVPHIQSVTTLVAVGAGSRFEDKKTSGISHFLEHMFFKGSRKYPSTEIISSLIDGLGAVNNAATDKEVTFYWVKSASKHVDIASSVLSSMLKESLMAEEEIEREKGVIAEEQRMFKDSPSRYIWDLYIRLQFGDQPLGWDTAGDEATINSFKREDFLRYMDSLYSPKNMVLVYAGNLPKNIEEIAKNHFLDLPERKQFKPKPFKLVKQTGPKVDVFYKKTDQVNLILGTLAYERGNPKKYAARVLAAILGEGMSSRLFIQVRERRGLAYHVGADVESFADTGCFMVYGGVKLEKAAEALEVIIAELQRTVAEKVTPEELKKAKEMIRGRLALRTESTNFLAEYHGLKYILEGNVETFEDYLKELDKVSAEDVQKVAKELFQRDQFNLQIIGPFKDNARFKKLLG
jgi:predicted Zn-dependent peptidase